MRRPEVRHVAWLAAAWLFVCSNLIAQKRTVWDGVYTATEAERGATAYKATCAACHGADLRGDGTAPSLSGDDFSFQWSDTTVADLFNRIRKAMPPDRPDSLSPEVYRDVVAFLLQFNKIPAGQADLDPDPESLRQISITAAPR